MLPHGPAKSGRGSEGKRRECRGEPGEEEAVVPNENDVLFGRGVVITCHLGNKRFRSAVDARKSEFSATARKRVKRGIAEDVVRDIRRRGGRFLIEDRSGRAVQKKKRKVAVEGGGGEEGDSNVHPTLADKAWAFATLEQTLEKVLQRLREKEGDRGGNDDSDRDSKSDSSSRAEGARSTAAGGGELEDPPERPSESSAPARLPLPDVGRGIPSRGLDALPPASTMLGTGLPTPAVPSPGRAFDVPAAAAVAASPRQIPIDAMAIARAWMTRLASGSSLGPSLPSSGSNLPSHPSHSSHPSVPHAPPPVVPRPVPQSMPQPVPQPSSLLQQLQASLLPPHQAAPSQPPPPPAPDVPSFHVTVHEQLAAAQVINRRCALLAATDREEYARQVPNLLGAIDNVRDRLTVWTASRRPAPAAAPPDLPAASLPADPGERARLLLRAIAESAAIREGGTDAHPASSSVQRRQPPSVVPSIPPAFPWTTAILAEVLARAGAAAAVAVDPREASGRAARTSATSPVRSSSSSSSHQGLNRDGGDGSNDPSGRR